MANIICDCGCGTRFHHDAIEGIDPNCDQCNHCARCGKEVEGFHCESMEVCNQCMVEMYPDPDSSFYVKQEEDGSITLNMRIIEDKQAANAMLGYASSIAQQVDEVLDGK